MNQFRSKGLTAAHLNREVEYLIPGFLVKNAITLLYAPPKNGKSKTALAIACNLADRGMTAQYVDWDNPVTALLDRGADKAIDPNVRPTLDYIHPEMWPMTSREVIDALVEKAVDGAYRNYIFIIDSAKDFVDVNNEQAVTRFMNDMKRIRNAGGTIILLHHTGKSGKNYEGSGTLKSASDNIYYLREVEADETSESVLLEVDAARFRVEQQVAFVRRNDWSLERILPSDLEIGDKEKEVIDKAKKLLAKAKAPLTQSALLEGMGLNKADKTATAILHKYAGRHWVTTKGPKNRTLYKTPPRTDT